jgi:hypothetical protein
MRKLNLPAYEFRYRTEGEMQQVLDVYRKRFVVFTPRKKYGSDLPVIWWRRRDSRPHCL